jgi:hypothetical protein
MNKSELIEALATKAELPRRPLVVPWMFWSKRL